MPARDGWWCPSAWQGALYLVSPDGDYVTGITLRIVRTPALSMRCVCEGLYFLHTCAHFSPLPMRCSINRTCHTSLHACHCDTCTPGMRRTAALDHRSACRSYTIPSGMRGGATVAAVHQNYDVDGTLSSMAELPLQCHIWCVKSTWCVLFLEAQIKQVICVPLKHECLCVRCSKTSCNMSQARAYMITKTVPMTEVRAAAFARERCPST